MAADICQQLDGDLRHMERDARIQRDRMMQEAEARRARPFLPPRRFQPMAKRRAAFKYDGPTRPNSERPAAMRQLARLDHNLSC